MSTLAIIVASIAIATALLKAGTALVKAVLAWSAEIAALRGEIAALRLGLERTRGDIRSECRDMIAAEVDKINESCAANRKDCPARVAVLS